MERDEILKTYVQKITKLPTIPGTAQEILALLSDENATVDKLEKIIENDPAISAKIMSVANSAFFSVKMPVKTLSNAIMRIGFNNVKNIALGISLMTVLGDVDRSRPMDYRRVFNHSVTVGFVARMLAKGLKIKIPDEVLMDGLLHDLGYLVLNKFFPGNYRRVLEEFEHRESLIDAEMEVLNFNHGHIGAWLGEKWNLPDSVVDSMLYHHDPCSAKRNVKQVCIVHLADFITSENILPPIKEDPKYTFFTEVFDILGITEESFREIEQEIKKDSSSLIVEIA